MPKAAMNAHTCESLNNVMVCSTLTLYLKKFELLRLTADALYIWPASRHWSLSCIELWPKLLLSFPRKLPCLSTCIERMIDRNIKVWITIVELYKNAVSTSNHESCWCHGRQPTTKHTALIAQTISLSWGTAVLTWLLALISLHGLIRQQEYYHCYFGMVLESTGAVVAVWLEEGSREGQVRA